MAGGSAILPRTDTPCSNFCELTIVSPINSSSEEEAIMQQTVITDGTKADKKDIVVGAINLVAALMA